MKTFYSFLCLVILTGHVHGQTAKPDRPWRFGVLAGLPVAGKIYDNGKMQSASGLVVAADLGYYFEDRKSGPSLHFQPGFSTFKKTETDGRKDGRYYVESICGIISCNEVSGGQSIQNVASKDKVGILAGVGVEMDAGKITIPLSVRLVDTFLKPKVSDDLGLTQVPSNLRTKLVQVTAGFSL
ncbi:hypothetical protein J2Y45_003827 [Dyadobacter sp. BE34]|uniref:Outer membrane protein beta-barrel domain-containing protein n=1 Tax=Dyadobacter fermentans TaxID=94254 RepID=A0ABU1R274_9BACT|nr:MULTISPECIES: hypothetical protein [Dyadobacter]MDR6806635.1 hypothetical protein [Dyadobacter fermentans]MDR7044377.1 hypothetical protein [Dyadobacter sp. BE242]MDR7198687.1 hypothetical protein [Dyadobacter sp. BE34]MDR7216649.1 hypothetical protein [Dyadobacter sp. BE31]MDR7263825.1 hypothetical protein [Dyadobacter sp. BE32]